MVKKALLVAIIIIFVAFSIFATMLGMEKIIDKYSPSEQVVPFFSQSETMLIIEDQLIINYAPPVVIDGEVLLPFDTVKEYIDPTIFKDKGGRVVTITSEDRVIRMNSLEKETYVNMEPIVLDFTSRYINNILYLPVVTFRELFEIDITYNEDSDVVIIDYWKNFIHRGFVSPYVKEEADTENSDVIRSNRIADNVAIRRTPSLKSPLFRTIPEPGEEVTVYEIDGMWARIRTSEGIIGYVETRFLEAAVEKKDITINLVRRNKDEPKRIVMAWQYINETTPPVEEFISHDTITVYSPTWFYVIDEEGNMESRADTPYVDKVRELDSVIWPLVSNTFNDIKMTSAVLNNPAARDNVIRQLLAYAQLYQVDGFNIDFENIYLRDKDAYTQFIRELMPYARDMGLVITVDVGIPGGSDNYSLCYDHSELSKTADYIVVMTYDQFWASSPIAGSQAQLTWVEKMINLTLEAVDPDKLILGIPFYTRIWREDDGTVRNIAATGMDRTAEIIEETAAYIKWDEESGQYYATYYKEGTLHKMWIEDATSVGLKAELSLKYGLRGAIWQLSQGNDSAWESIGNTLDKKGAE